MNRVIKPALVAFGVLQLAQGLVMAIAPRFFYDQVGPFGIYNEHYVRDAATWSLALGVVLLVAVNRASWRVPVLAFATLQFGLHTINHIVDVGEASSQAIGIFDAVFLGVTTILLAGLVRYAAEDERVPPKEVLR